MAGFGRGLPRFSTLTPSLAPDLLSIFPPLRRCASFPSLPRRRARRRALRHCRHSFLPSSSSSSASPTPRRDSQNIICFAHCCGECTRGPCVPRAPRRSPPAAARNSPFPALEKNDHCKIYRPLWCWGGCGGALSGRKSIGTAPSGPCRGDVRTTPWKCAPPPHFRAEAAAAARRQRGSGRGAKTPSTPPRCVPAAAGTRAPLLGRKRQ